MQQAVLTEVPENISTERYFADAHDKSQIAGSETRNLLKAVGRVQKSLRLGDVGSCVKGIEEVREASALVVQAISALSSFRADLIQSAFRNVQYFQEVAELAASRGLTGVRSTEGKLFSYPYVVERKKVGLMLAIGSRTTKNIRPSAVVEELATARKGKARFNQQSLLDVIEQIYDLCSRDQSTDFVDIEEIYKLLTLLPGSDKEYPLLDFLASLDEIKRNRLTTSKTGKVLDLPPPSTVGKGGRAFRVIREDGREQLYRMLRIVAKLPSEVTSR